MKKKTSPREHGIVGMAMGVKLGTMKLDEVPPDLKKKVQFVLSSGAVDNVGAPPPKLRNPFATREPLRRARTA